MPIAIKAEHLSKEYRLGTIGHGMLFKDLQSAWARFRGTEDPNKKILAGANNSADQFWALNNVSFELHEGETIGIIGRNGAGKSTLLKILSRVTAPSVGRISIKGRVASLLEVGTGFHPELSGRENIFLNGAILGMSKKKIKSQIDEIIHFSGIERHIDTPVKRYSSGMYVRLAFSVAAHLDSDILVVDEVLAVGDADFQRKCIGKMEAVGKGGRTVIFVSHNLSAISRFCPKSIYLDKGQLIQFENTAAVIENYLRSGTFGHSGQLDFDRNISGPIKLLHLEITGKGTKAKDVFRSDENIQFHLTYEVTHSVANLSLYLDILSNEQEGVWNMCDWESNPHLLKKRDKGIWSTKWVVPANFLRPGTYFARVGTHTQHKDLLRPEPVPFEITIEGTNRLRFKHWSVVGGPIAYPMRILGPKKLKRKA